MTCAEAMTGKEGNVVDDSSIWSSDVDCSAVADAEASDAGSGGCDLSWNGFCHVVVLVLCGQCISGTCRVMVIVSLRASVRNG